MVSSSRSRQAKTLDVVCLGLGGNLNHFLCIAQKEGWPGHALSSWSNQYSSDSRFSHSGRMCLCICCASKDHLKSIGPLNFDGIPLQKYLYEIQSLMEYHLDACMVVGVLHLQLGYSALKQRVYFTPSLLCFLGLRCVIDFFKCYTRSCAVPSPSPSTTSSSGTVKEVWACSVSFPSFLRNFMTNAFRVLSKAICESTEITVQFPS